MDNYRIIKFLNEGSYGKIYLVEHNVTKDRYALKTINIEGIDRYNKVCILNEIKILLINDNPFLLKCYDLFIDDSKLCLITEYISGGDLNNYINQNKINSEQQLVEIFYKICIGINSLHSNHIIHRDIKPGNILITEYGDVRICDFGICKFLDYNKVTNTSIGTPYFMSPEQMGAQYYDYKIDVWGIGCVLYYLLYNSYPFDGRNMIELKKNIQEKNPCINNNNNKHSFLSFNTRYRLETILKEMFEKNKYKRLDLNLFLDKSTKLLKYYNIPYNNKKYYNYKIKNVPSTITDWNILIAKIKKDFNLPNFPFKKHITNTFQFLEDSLEKQPDIITYAEIKRSQKNIINSVPNQKIKIKKYKQNDMKSPPTIDESTQLKKLIKNRSVSQLEQNNKKRCPSQLQDQYNKKRPYSQLEEHNKIKNFIETLRRNKVQASINDRKVRIRHQKCNIEIERKKALERIKKHKKKTQQYAPTPNPDFNQNLSNMKHRIRRVESRIKHLWAQK